MTPEQLNAQLAVLVTQLCGVNVDFFQTEISQFHQDTRNNPAASLPTQIAIKMNFIWRFYLRSEYTIPMPDNIKIIFDQSYRDLNLQFEERAIDTQFNTPELQLLVKTWKARNEFKDNRDIIYTRKAAQGTVGGIIATLLGGLMLAFSSQNTKPLNESSSEDSYASSDLLLTVLFFLLSNATVFGLRTHYYKEIEQALNQAINNLYKKLGKDTSISLDDLHYSIAPFFEKACITPQILLGIVYLDTFNPNNPNVYLYNIISPIAGLAAGKMLDAGANKMLNMYDRFQNMICGERERNTTESTHLINDRIDINYSQP